MPESNITITVDESALRKQVAGVVKEELREASFALRRAANTIDPEWQQEEQRQLELYYRAQWEREDHIAQERVEAALQLVKANTGELATKIELILTGKS